MHITILRKRASEKKQVRLQKRVPDYTKQQEARFGRFTRIPKHFDARQVERNITLDRLEALYADLRNDPEACIAFGAHKPGAINEYWDEASGMTTGITNTPKMAVRSKEAFRDDPVDVFVIDCDGKPYLDGWDDERFLSDPETCVRLLAEDLLGEVPDMLFVASSKTGRTGKFRGHLWVRSNRPLTFTDWSMLLGRLNAKSDGIDTSIAVPGHILFSAAPVFVDGNDPFEGRPRTIHICGDPYDIQMSKGELRRVGTKRQQRLLVARQHPFPVDSFNDRVDSRYNIGMRWVGACCASGCSAHAILAAWDKVEPQLDLVGSRLSRADIERQAGEWFRDDFDPPENAFEEPDMTAEEASAAMTEAMMKLERGQHLFRVTPGVGKSHAALNLARGWARRGGSVVYLAPTLDRATEMQRRYFLGEDADRSTWGKESQVWFGKNHHCQIPDQLATVRRFGQHLEGDFCKACPFRDGCGWFGQFRERRQVVFAASAMLANGGVIFDPFINDATGEKGELLIIIDETFVDHLSGQLRIGDLSEIMQRPDPELVAIATRVWLHLTDEQSRPSKADLERALELEGQFRVTLDPHHGFEDAKALEEDLKKQRMHDRPAFRAFYRALLSGLPNSLHVFKPPETPEKPNTKWKADVSWAKSAKAEGALTLMLDATPDIGSIRQIYPDLQVHDFRARTRRTHITQVVDRRGNRGMFLNWMGETPPEDQEKLTEWEEAERHAMERRDELGQWLARQPYGTMLFATRKDTHLKMEAEHDLSNVHWMHWKALEGQDEFNFEDGVAKGQDVDAIVLEGRPLPPPYVLEALARKRFAKDPEPVIELGWYWDEKRKRLMPNWYDQAGVKVWPKGIMARPVHPDPRVQGIVDEVCAGQLLQALHRARPVRRDRWLHVYILHDVAMPVHVDQIASWDEVMAREGPLQHMSQKFTGGARQETEYGPEIKFWTKEGQKKPFSARVAGCTMEDAAWAEALLVERYGAIRCRIEGRLADVDWEAFHYVTTFGGDHTAYADACAMLGYEPVEEGQIIQRVMALPA